MRRPGRCCYRFFEKIRDEDDDRDNNFNRIVMALNRINETHMASYNCSPNYSRLNEVAGGRFDLPEIIAQHFGLDLPDDGQFGMGLFFPYPQISRRTVRRCW